MFEGIDLFYIRKQQYMPEGGLVPNFKEWPSFKMRSSKKGPSSKMLRRNTMFTLEKHTTGNLLIYTF